MDGFALGIEAIQPLSRLKRRQTIARSQHIEGILSRCQSPCRIHARAKTKAERPSGNLGWLHPSHRQQCLEARAALLLQHLEPPVHIGAVLILERYYVAHGAERHQVQQPLLVASWQARQHRLQRLDKLESHACPTEVTEGIVVVVIFRINRGDGGWASRCNVVVVGHHCVDVVALLGIGNFLMAEATAVHRDDQLRPHRCHLVHRAFGHAITLYEAIRNKGLHRGKAKAGKGIKQQCRRTEAVDIIIAINHNCFAPLVRLHQAIHRRLHLGE